ncbi:DNA polymerase III subunit delta [Aurantimonas sp. MSK8Z-1]|uniref:DNA polymerase III subunit delta n=1 Tax=Mangrovibrevibacter kandeliae TaxID=2968473 RepID=UPI0021182059|nr:DNA polymerase III subunit delta [Aurantimonas sp. MSK8Z-1]MCW4115056.1 DNA polymerase III subunit delta [Aurantimonas sp. MSK8Z-1]
MGQKKAGEVEGFVARPDYAAPVLLLYGPDAGLVSERAERLAAASGVDATDPFAAVLLVADELEKDVGRLFDEARTVSLFGGRRLIRIKGAGNGKSLADAVAELGAAPPQDAVVIIEAGDLKKSSALRVSAERARGALALPCYQDEARALDQMIDEELRLAGLTLPREARDLLRSRLGANRMASRGEVRKLCLYCYGQSEIGEADILEIVGDVSAEALDEAVDAAATGEVRKLPHHVDRLVSGGTQPFLLLQSLLRHLQALQAMRNEVERHGETVARAVERRRPHFRRKGALEAALQLWTLDALAQALLQVEAAILLSRKESGLAETVVRQTLVAIAVSAARQRSRGARRAG